MPRKKMTPEERKAFGEKMKAARAAKQQLKEEGKLTEPEESKKVDTPDQQVAELQRQMDEIMETNALLKAALVKDGRAEPTMSSQGSLVGQFERYTLDPAEYPSPVERLAAEPRLKPLAFDYNYQLDYDFTTRQYDTKQGINTIEPEFTITLWKNVLDDEGEVTKKYRARRLVFHEDPQAALVMARTNNILVDRENERDFLNEMRYLRVRDWLFDVFFPKGPQEVDAIREEVIGNRLVEVVTVKSADAKDMGDRLKNTDKIKF